MLKILSVHHLGYVLLTIAIFLIIGHHVEHSEYNIQSCWCCWLLGYQVMGHHVAHEDVQHLCQYLLP